MTEAVWENFKEAYSIEFTDSIRYTLFYFNNDSILEPYVLDTECIVSLAT